MRGRRCRAAAAVRDRSRDDCSRCKPRLDVVDPSGYERSGGCEVRRWLFADECEDDVREVPAQLGEERGEPARSSHVRRMTKAADEEDCQGVGAQRIERRVRLSPCERDSRDHRLRGRHSSNRALVLGREDDDRVGGGGTREPAPPPTGDAAAAVPDRRIVVDDDPSRRTWRVRKVGAHDAELGLHDVRLPLHAQLDEAVGERSGLNTGGPQRMPTCKRKRPLSLAPGDACGTTDRYPLDLAHELAHGRKGRIDIRLVSAPEREQADTVPSCVKLNEPCDTPAAAVRRVQTRRERSEHEQAAVTTSAHRAATRATMPRNGRGAPGAARRSSFSA